MPGHCNNEHTAAVTTCTKCAQKGGAGRKKGGKKEGEMEEWREGMMNEGLKGRKGIIWEERSGHELERERDGSKWKEYKHCIVYKFGIVKEIKNKEK